MKEITLQELLNMADATAHDGIGDLWNQKTIHYLVIFTSENEDFELIGVGPTLPFITLEAVTAHAVPGKKPEFYVKCPGALAVKLQPKLAPSLLNKQASQARANTTPSLKGRTSTPFVNSQPKPSDAPADSAPKSPALGSATTKQTLAVETALASDAPLPLAERERLIKHREQELATLSASLRAREALLRDREAAIAAIEERLLNPMR